MLRIFKTANLCSPMDFAFKSICHNAQRNMKLDLKHITTLYEGLHIFVEIFFETCSIYLLLLYKYFN